MAIWAPLAAAIREAFVGAVPREIADEPIAPPHLVDIADGELADAPLSKPSVEQAPPPASMPIPHRYVSAEPQNYPHTPVDDNWFIGTPRVLLDAAC